MKILNTSLSLGLVALLTACGGGGGAATAPAPSSASLNATNQDIAAQDAAVASFMPLVGAQSLTGAQVLDESALFAVARQQINQFPVYMANTQASGALVGVVQMQTMGCTSGGSMTVTVNDADNNGVLSAGDSMTMTANNCVETMGTMTGSMSITVTTLSGSFTSSSSTNYSLGVVMTFTSLAISAGQSSASMNGSLTMSATKNGQYSLTETLSTPSLTVSETYAGATRSSSMSSYSATATQAPDATYTFLTSYTTSGTLTSTGLSSQAISFATPTPFVRRGMDYYPSTGVMVISGGSNSKVRATAMNNTQVLLELDANGDGTYESSKTVPWTSLM